MNKPGGWKQHAGFTVFFDYTVDDGGKKQWSTKIWRTKAYHDESGNQLLVYYGFEILEIVPDDPESAAYKLMLGRLYDSGLKLGSLCDTFQVDPKTLRRWGQALKGSPEEMVRILEGRTAKRKRTVEVEAFARLRWPDLITGEQNVLKGWCSKIRFADKILQSDCLIICLCAPHGGRKERRD